jgi:hypothetical protein
MGFDIRQERDISGWIMVMANKCSGEEVTKSYDLMRGGK